ncbi:MAG: YhfT family protein [Negativicutes bacterium]
MLLKYTLMFLAGALGAVLANRGIAVFNDAVRPIMPEYREKRMSRAELAATTFALSFGLIIGFGIPFSLMSPIILVHCLWLGTDIIGVFFPADWDKKWYTDRKNTLGFAGAAVAGGIYGIGLLAGLQWFVDAMQQLPVNVFDGLSILGDPVLFAFAAFPALAIAMEYGFKKGAAALMVTVVVRQLIAISAWYSSADGCALLAGFVMLLFFAMQEKNTVSINMASLFGDRVKNIKKNLPYIALVGAVYGMAAHIHLLVGSNLTLLALAKNQMTDAVNLSVISGFSYIPLKGMTSLATGVWVTDGFGFVVTAGLLSPNLLVAAITGAIVIVLEASSLVLFANVFDRFPGLKKSADNMRAAMTKVLELALLVGSMMAANKMFPGMGFLIVAGAYCLNEVSKRPLIKMAVGPIAAIATGIIVNILAWLHLFAPAVK